MLKGLFSKVVGDPNQRSVQKLEPLVDQINALEPTVERLTNEELGALTRQFRARQAAGETLDDLLAEAFAAVREVAKRTVDMRPFDVQLIGGIVLHQGKVAEMRTGEGKTLVATLPVYLNALTGGGVHLVTVNDYLARRDLLWMGPIYHLMGLSAGLLQSGADQPAYLYDPSYQRDPYPGLRPVPRREAYAADITYGTNNEFGFDYLRDNIALSLEQRVQRPLNYAIVDEVDNIFIDEARTPLIISGPSGEPVEEYSLFAAIARKLEANVHYELDEKERSVFLTEEGLAMIEQETGIENIYDEANYRYVHYMQQALKAQVLFLEGRDYIRQRKQIILIDPHTGRLMPNRRLSEGLHQAIEAKEAVPVQPRDVTSATITIQNYFRMYNKLAGMSGTAVTESEEFFKIYQLDVVAIPTNKQVIRADHPDVVYRSAEAKMRAVARELLACHCKGQPVLVGTTSVEMSERLSKRLDAERLQMATIAPRLAYALQDAKLEREPRDSLRQTLNDSLETMNLAAWRKAARDLDVNPNALSADNLEWIAQYLEMDHDPTARQALERALRDGIPHEVLNAKEHTREAAIIARAGEPGAVTIATNMAGRGVDIKLGGDLPDEVIHKAHQALRNRGLDPFRATSAQMDSAVAEVAPQYAKRRDQVLSAGGLHVLGTERHEARRIDNQLRGRSGRQGEPGSSRFFISLEDDLMRRFGRKEMLAKLMEQMGDDFPIEHGLVSKTIERAQTSVEGHNFDIRKHLLEYDDVLNRQRESIYSERLRILQSDDLRAEVQKMLAGQIDEYAAKWEDPEQLRLTFAGLDDVAPLTLPAPNGPFPGPVAFGGHLTAFPPFTISFLADQFEGQPLEAVQQNLDQLAQQAAYLYGEQLSQTVSEVSRTTLEKYQERLERYQILLSEKINDHIQLAEDRGQEPDLRKLVQHLERTFPLKLTTPADRGQMDLDDLQNHWSLEIEIEYHRLTIEGLLERVLVRLPPDLQLDRLRPAQIAEGRLFDELKRVREMAVKQALDPEARNRLEGLALPAQADASQVLELVSAFKENSQMDYGRLDRLVGHVLGVEMDQLIVQYQQAADPDQANLLRELERLREATIEGKKAGRSTDLFGLIRQLNALVHLEISDADRFLTLAIVHEYDKWAQRQLAEIRTNTRQNPLHDTSWTALCEHLLAVHYTQRQAYDSGHRRLTSWMPLLPLSFLAQVHAESMDRASLRDALLDSIQWAAEQREQSWGKQEFERWKNLSLADLPNPVREGLLRFLGEQALGDERGTQVEDLPKPLYDRLSFILALRQYQDRRLADLPHGSALLEHLGQALEAQILETPVGELEPSLQDKVNALVRRNGLLDDAQARAQFEQQPIQNWDETTRQEVAGFWGRQFIEGHQNDAIQNLPEGAREVTIDYLQRQRRFVDETQVQSFLVRQRLGDLPQATSQAALDYVARTRLERLSRRKISNLDVSTRQAVLLSLQKAGLFTDETRRQEILRLPLSELDPELRRGFGAYLARKAMGEGLQNLKDEARQHVLTALRQTDLLATPEQRQDLLKKRLAEIDPNTATSIVNTLTRQLRDQLASHTMETLPAEIRQQAHQALEDQDYFVDREKAAWYERNTLAQLAADLMRALEQHLGQIRLKALSQKPFPDLTKEEQAALEEALDRQELITDRAERLRLKYGEALSQLSDRDREALAKALGRQWLVRIRSQRLAALPKEERQPVWAFLRAQGVFVDEFKEELFAYQRLDEFPPAGQQAIQDAVVQQLTVTLASTPVGELPPHLRDAVLVLLRQAGLVMDPERVRLVEESPLAELPKDLRTAIKEELADYILAQMGSNSVAEMSEEHRRALAQYLDESGYLLDEEKQNQMLDGRLVDLEPGLFERLVKDLKDQLKNEIGEQAISDLDDDMRQALREAVEATGFFESAEERANILARPLGSLRREDLESLSQELGQAQWAQWKGRRLMDLPPQDRQATLDHLQRREWFLDRQRLEEMQAQSLGALDIQVRQELVDTLRREQLAQLGQQRLGRLRPDQYQAVLRFLRQEGLAVEENHMRALRRQSLQALDRDLYHDLVQDLGRERVAEWNAGPFRNLEPEQQAELSAYLGRRIMAHVEQRILLHTISRLWIDYLTDIEDLRRGIGLEAYGQRDPLVEYKRRAFELFEELGDNIRRTVARSLFRRAPEPLVAQPSN